MGLVQVATNTVSSSSVTQVQLTGIDDDSVYMVTINNMTTDYDNADIYLNYIKASDSSVDSTANYTSANKGLYSIATYQNNTQSGQNNLKIMYARGNLTTEKSNAIIYLYNTFSSSELSFSTFEANGYNYAGYLYGEQGSGVHTVAQSNEGVAFSGQGTGNFSIGSQFTLYKVV